MSVEYIANVGAIMQRKKVVFFLQTEDFFRAIVMLNLSIRLRKLERNLELLNSSFN